MFVHMIWWEFRRLFCKLTKALTAVTCKTDKLTVKLLCLLCYTWLLLIGKITIKLIQSSEGGGGEKRLRFP